MTARHYQRQARRAQRNRRNIARRLSYGLLGALGGTAGGLLMALAGWALNTVPIPAGSGLLALLMFGTFATVGCLCMMGGAVMIVDAITRRVV
jgi:hypothetical protein